MLIFLEAYFGRRRDQIVLGYETKYGADKWRLVWIVDGGATHTFEDACKCFYEESYYLYLKDRPADVDFICERAPSLSTDGSFAKVSPIPSIALARHGRTRQRRSMPSQAGETRRRSWAW